MADLISMADQYKGLPMSDLIGGPLKAACDAQVMLANATKDFIYNVGFLKDKDGNVTDPRTVQFKYSRVAPNPDHKADDNNPPTITEDMEINVPILAIVTVPNLFIDSLDITFDMSVHSASSNSNTFDATVGGKVTASGGIGPFSASVEISGSVHKGSTSTSTADNSATYHVEVHAKDRGMPEGLSRVLDFLHEAITPVPAKPSQPPQQGNVVQNAAPATAQATTQTPANNKTSSNNQTPSN